MRKSNKANTPLYARLLGRLTGLFPDFDFFFIKPVRAKAVGWLKLSPGARVLDLGCGSGGSFPFLVGAVGRAGEVIGVELSPASAESARRRVAKNAWDNVTVIESAAQTVDLTGTFDGALMFAAPDVFGSKEAIQHLLPFLKGGARVTVFGAKLSRHPIGRIFNPALRILMGLSFSSTPRLEIEPWGLLAEYVGEIEVAEYSLGLMFLMSGTIAKP